MEVRASIHVSQPAEYECRASKPDASRINILSDLGRPADRLEGRYWTDRETQGELTFSLRSATAVESYEQAEKLFGEGDSR